MSAVTRQIVASNSDTLTPAIAFMPRVNGEKDTPVSIFLESFGTMSNDYDIVKFNGENEGSNSHAKQWSKGTTQGGIFFCPPQTDIYQIGVEFKPFSVVQTEPYVAVTAGASFAAGLPYTNTGSIRRGYSWLADAFGALIFRRHAEDSTRQDAIRFTETERIGFRSLTGFWGDIYHENTANRIWKFPDISGTVALTTSPSSGIFTTKSVIFAGSNGLLTEDPNVFTYDSATKTFTVGKASTSTGIIQLLNSTNAFRITIKAGVTTANKDYVWPITDGSVNQAVITNGAGVLSFKSFLASGAGDIEQRGSVSFGAGVTSVAVVFASAYATAPNVGSSLDRAGASIQGWSIDSITTTGFTFRRSAAAGTATGHWIAIGT